MHEGMQMDEIRKRNTNDTVAQMKWGFKPEDKASAPNWVPLLLPKIPSFPQKAKLYRNQHPWPKPVHKVTMEKVNWQQHCSKVE